MEGVMKQASSGWKHLWETWDLRLAILFSLFLQIFLIFSAPLRKRLSKGYVLVPMWLAYLLADATAIFAAGLILRGQGDTYGPFASPALVAFWAPFLLVHLGGPDTITAFALEDNELWLRHALGLGFPSCAVVYAFYHSFPKSELRVSMLLIFIVGLIKYIERTRSLYLASSRTFKESQLREPDPGPKYVKLMDEYNARREAGVPVKVEMIPEPRNDPKSELRVLTEVQQAYYFFKTLKGLVADMILNFRENGETRDFFLNRTPTEAFKVVEVELNFLYDILFTKAMVVHCMLGYLLRIVSFTLNFSSLALFYFTKKKEFEKFDIGVTYTLLLGAIVLDLISFVMALYSDWTVVAPAQPHHPNWRIKILRNLPHVKRESWPKNLRWSESLSQFNLLSYCLHPRAKWWEKTVAIFGLTNLLDGVRYVEKAKFTNYLRDLIFEELKEKSKIADELDTAKKMCSARGDWILWYEGCTDFLRWINEVEFDESLLIWHLATELCFYTDKNSDDDSKKFRHMSKLLSDYMLYLLIVESSMISTLVGSGQIRFRDTCAEAKQFFRGSKIEELKKCCLDIFSFEKCCCKGGKGTDGLKIQACSSTLEVNTELEPAVVKGEGSKSVFFDACILAKELKKFEQRRMWEIISKVWVELLSYAACRSSTKTHAAQVGKGGQLMSFVWLLMAHLGLGNQFELTQVDARAKLVSR